ncbi:MAG TPA: vanadium-dependent haloperoxidase [Thermoanaerobaculia bacterium]|nr:vanadium-dependent haloperoxidase [Thermoanaerobaculia bacterium]
MLRKLFVSGLCAAALLGVAGPVRADVITDWVNLTVGSIRTDKTPPPKAARALALVQVAVFDAVNGLVGGYTPYFVTDPAPIGSSPEAAAAAAAHKVLVTLFPAQQAFLDGELANSLGSIPSGPAKTLGITWGEAVAGKILALRANDHSGDVVTANFPIGALWWVRTPPALAAPLLPGWPAVTPWGVDNIARFRPAPPPPPASADYEAAFNEVKSLGKVSSATRTADQTQIALFWADGGGTATPPGHWLLIARGIAISQNLSLIQNARLFALLGIAEADAATAAWDAKYYYNLWRPITAIQEADVDGNPDTAPDTTWTPLLATPNHPSYISGHSTFSAAAARILGLFFGNDLFNFTSTSDGSPGQRSYTSFSQAAQEAGQSRIYGGIHWQFDNTAGQATGRALAEQIFYNNLTPAVQPFACVQGPTSLCLENTRFKVEATWRTAVEIESGSGPGRAIPQANDFGQFWFFSADNVELSVKVLNGCALNNHFWVFASGLTDVEVVLTVTDSDTGASRTYFSPKGHAFTPVQDTAAFPCP